MKTIITTVFILFSTFCLIAQETEYMNYQSVVRDASGVLMKNKNISIRFSILKSAAVGQSQYRETHTVTTNEFGLVNLKIGSGNVISGDYMKINWADDKYFLKVDLDVNGGTAFTDMGVQQLISVPYAIHAKTASSVQNSDNDTTNELQQITLSNDTIQLNKNGGILVLPKIDNTNLIDKDEDTKISVEQNADEDVIRFLTEGVEYFKMEKGRLEVKNTGGSVFIGEGAGATDDFTDNRQVGIGDSALSNISSGYSNTALGYQSLMADSSGYLNTAAGHRTLSNTGSGFANTAIGGDAMERNTSGAINVGVGVNALRNNRVGAYNIAVGQAVGSNDSSSGNIGIGNLALWKHTKQDNNVAIGTESMIEHLDGSGNVAMGYSAMKNNTDENYSVAIGYEALLGSPSTTGNARNIAIGYQSMRDNQTGFDNIGIGEKSLFDNDNGFHNVGIGALTLESNTTGAYNIAIGEQAVGSNRAFNYNIGLGSFALSRVTGGGQNIGIGRSSLITLTSGTGNIAVGDGSGRSVATGSWNTFIGSAAGYSSNTGNYSFSAAFGYVANITASNQMRIGNSSTSSIGGYRSWSNISDARFKINIKEDVKGMDFIMGLRPVTYNLDLNKLDQFLGVPDSLVTEEFLAQRKLAQAEVQSGFLAQEVDSLAQNLGFSFSGVDAPKNNNDHYGLRYAEFVVPLVKGMQEQQAIINDQALKLKELEDLIEKQNLIVQKLLLGQIKPPSTN